MRVRRVREYQNSFFFDFLSFLLFSEMIYSRGCRFWSHKKKKKVQNRLRRISGENREHPKSCCKSLTFEKKVAAVVEAGLDSSCTSSNPVCSAAVHLGFLNEKTSISTLNLTSHAATWDSKKTCITRLLNAGL